MDKYERSVETCNPMTCWMWELNHLGVVKTSIDECRIIDANPAFFQYTGFDAGEVLGRSPAELNLYPKPDAHHSLLRLLARETTLDDIPVTLRGKDGAHLDFRCTTFQIDRNHRLTVLCAIGEANTFYEKALAKKDTMISYLNRRLEKMDVTLNVMIEKRERAKIDFHKRISDDIQRCVIPLIKK